MKLASSHLDEIEEMIIRRSLAERSIESLVQAWIDDACEVWDEENGDGLTPLGDDPDKQDKILKLVRGAKVEQVLRKAYKATWDRLVGDWAGSADEVFDVQDVPDVIPRQLLQTLAQAHARRDAQEAKELQRMYTNKQALASQLLKIAEQLITAEAVEISKFPAAAKDQWPDVMYKGEPVLDKLYPAVEKAAQQLIRKEVKLDVDYSESSGELAGLQDMQEVYLGYVPKKDIFVIGFDAFFEHESEEDDMQDPDWEHGSLWAAVKYSNGKAKADDLDMAHFGFYDKNGGLKAVRRSYPGIVDLRLD